MLLMFETFPVVLMLFWHKCDGALLGDQFPESYHIVESYILLLILSEEIIIIFFLLVAVYKFIYLYCNILIYIGDKS